MGNADLIITINDWFCVLVMGHAYNFEKDALDTVLRKYYEREAQATSSEDGDPEFDWSIRTITVSTRKCTIDTKEPPSDTTR